MAATGISDQFNQIQLDSVASVVIKPRMNPQKVVIGYAVIDHNLLYRHSPQVQVYLWADHG